MPECTDHERDLLDALKEREANIDFLLRQMADNAKLNRLEDQRGKPLPSIYVCTPSHTTKLDRTWVFGAMQAQLAFRGRIVVDDQVGSILPRNRDMLTDKFLDSGASHMLCVDSDIGWHPAQVQALLDTGKPFISGTYCKKQANCEIPAKFTGRREGAPFATMTSNPKNRGEILQQPLWEAIDVPAGFLLLERQVVERMVGAYRNMMYTIPNLGMMWALWYPLFEPGVTYSGEDIAFCSRWRKIGGEIWMHRGVVLPHYGMSAFVPDADDIHPVVNGKPVLPAGPAQPVQESLDDELVRSIRALPPDVLEQIRSGRFHAAPETPAPEATRAPPVQAPAPAPNTNGQIKMHGTLPVHVHGGAS